MFTTKPAVLAALLAPLALAHDCSYFYDLQCTSGDQTNQPESWTNRTFQTPLPGSDNWKPEY
jgi:hypothetical protein